MKKLSLTLILLLTVCILSFNSLYGQSYSGSTFGQVNLGFTGIGAYASAHYINNFNQKISGIFGGGIEYATKYDLKYQSFYLDGLVSLKAWQLDKRGTITTGSMGGIFVSVDNIGDFKNEKTSKSSDINYGVSGGTEIIWSAGRQFSFVGSALLKYSLKENFNIKGNWRYQVGVGLRYRL